MTGPWKGAGASIGEGLAMFTQNFIQRQDQLKQQQQQEQMYRQQLEQQRLQNERQREQMDLQARQQQQNEAAQQYTRERTDRLDALGQREDELTKVLSPQVNTFMQGVTADLQRYAPTLSDGRPNPQYNPALFEAAQARSKQVKKLWSTLSLSVGAGQGYEEAKQALLGFVGGDVQPTPTPTAQPAMPQAATPAPVTVTEPGGASFGYTPEAAPAPSSSPAPTGQAQPATPAPVTSDMPANITQIPPSQLMDMDDAQITARYGQGGLEYANAARTQYAAQVQAQNAAAAKTRADAWDIQLKELSKDTTLTGQQRFAALRISDLMSRPTLTPEEQKDLRDSFALLTPVMYTATSWQKVLDTKDPMVILAQLPVYQAHAPQVVAGFDPEPLIQMGQSTLDKNAADAAQSSGAARKSNADADRTAALLPGELAQQGADLANTQADTAGTVATTAKTVQDTKGAGYDLGVKKLSLIAGTNATVYQIQQSNPKLWYELKQSLNVNDAGLTALLQQARYEYNQGLRGKDLELKLKAAQITNTQAQTGNTLADTQETLTLLPGKVAQQGAETALTVAQMQGENADTARTLTLTPLDAANTQAQTANTQANTALSWARVGEVQQNLKLDREKTAAYIKGVEGKYAVDMAQVGNLTARTALTRAQDPNDPLYNPIIANSKPGDPVAALKNQAGLYYTQADKAKGQAQALQTQINGLVKQGTGVTGVFDKTRLSPADQKQLDSLTKQRDALMRQAQAARQKGDDVITNGMQKLPVGGAPGNDPYGTQDVGGVKMVTAFPSKYPVPKTFTSDARFHISKVAGELGVDANALAAVISFETAGTFNPAAKNPNSSGSGLIQFMESTAKGMGTTTAALRAMPFGTQMQYVKRYLQERGVGPGSSMADIYQAVAGSGYKRGTPEYDQNKVWDANGNGVIEAHEQTLNPVFAGHVRDYFGSGRANAQQGPQKPGATPAKTTTAGPAQPASSTTGPLKAEASVNLIKAAPTPQALATIRDRLVAGGMTADQATAYIRKVKTGS